MTSSADIVHYGNARKKGRRFEAAADERGNKTDYAPALFEAEIGRGHAVAWTRDHTHARTNKDVGLGRRYTALNDVTRRTQIRDNYAAVVITVTARGHEIRRINDMDRGDKVSHEYYSTWWSQLRGNVQLHGEGRHRCVHQRCPARNI